MKAYRWFVDVILPLPLPRPYTYGISVRQTELLKPGCRIIVQFGKRKNHTAIIQSLHQNKPVNCEVKGIISVLDDKPTVSSKQLLFWEWIADYYMCTPGEVFRSALPAAFRLESETRLFADEADNQMVKLTESEILIHSVLKENQGLTLNRLISYTGKKNILTAIKSMLEKGIIAAEEHLKERYKPKYRTYIRLNPAYKNKRALNELMNKLERSPKQLNLLLKYLELSKIITDRIGAEVGKSELLKKTASGQSVISLLIKKKIFETYQKEVSRLSDRFPVLQKMNELNNSQRVAFEKILGKFRDSNVVLLHGVASGGKTEIYIRLIADQIKKNKQVLYLLPEIALTVQIIRRLQNVFGEKVGIYHSKLSDSERVEIYNNLNGFPKPGQSHYQVILGVRSSIFLPFQELGLVIVDEEHENTYKQYDPAPRYHARDASIMLANIHRAKVVLGTATPSLESYYNAQIKKYGLVELKDRYLNLEMPEIIVVDLKAARKRKEMQSHFSRMLISSIATALENEEQIILFLNRRGFSSYLECDNCGWVPVCKHCDVSLTYHKENNRLICHYCGYTLTNLKTCQSCNSTSLLSRGFGTEKIEEDVSIMFPNKKITRLDLDNTRKRDAYQTIISKFETGQIDILVGTQMVSKGLDFNNVKVVGILNADNMLNYPDFRSYERSFQLMAQVAGRAGRKNGRGKVIIQTTDPKNPVIRSVTENDYESMFHDQLNERRKFGYPPYCRLINIILKHTRIPILNSASDELAAMLKLLPEVTIVGPEFSLISKIRNMNLKNILLKLKKDHNLLGIKIQIKTCIEDLLSNHHYNNLRITVDVDPM
ncbi:MAG: primosomal protein N' [Bacteroidales bacterium]|nr:primosomal protein N' [Bacteroidales bacterium]